MVGSGGVCAMLDVSVIAMVRKLLGGDGGRCGVVGVGA